MSDKWDRRFLDLARLVASWSLDPSTKCGACVVDPRNRIVSVGYNGFARGVLDTPDRYADRETKYRLIVHAERNAVLFAGRDLTGCTLYTVPFGPCSQCAAIVIQAGITRVVAPPIPPDKADRWGDDMALAAQQFREARVELETVPDPDPPPADTLRRLRELASQVTPGPLESELGPSGHYALTAPHQAGTGRTVARVYCDIDAEFIRLAWDALPSLLGED